MLRLEDMLVQFTEVFLSLLRGEFGLGNLEPKCRDPGRQLFVGLTFLLHQPELRSLRGAVRAVSIRVQCREHRGSLVQLVSFGAKCRLVAGGIRKLGTNGRRFRLQIFEISLGGLNGFFHFFQRGVCDRCLRDLKRRWQMIDRDLCKLDAKPLQLGAAGRNPLLRADIRVR